MCGEVRAVAGGAPTGDRPARRRDRQKTHAMGQDRAELAPPRPPRLARPNDRASLVGANRSSMAVRPLPSPAHGCDLSLGAEPVRSHRFCASRGCPVSPRRRLPRGTPAAPLPWRRRGVFPAALLPWRPRGVFPWRLPVASPSGALPAAPFSRGAPAALVPAAPRPGASPVAPCGAAQRAIASGSTATREHEEAGPPGSGDRLGVCAIEVRRTGGPPSSANGRGQRPPRRCLSVWSSRSAWRRSSSISSLKTPLSSCSAYSS
jgi:hypothetical protein